MRIDATGSGPEMAARAMVPTAVQVREAAQPVDPVLSLAGGATPAERAQAEKAAAARAMDRYDPDANARPALETRIGVDDRTHQTYVQVLDTRQHEVVLEFPPERIRLLSESLAEAAGVNLDAKA